MARNNVKRGAETQSRTTDLEDGTRVDAPAMIGGTSGAPEDPNPKSSHITGVDPIAPARELAPEKAIEPRRFEVVGTTGKRDSNTGAPIVMYAGCITRVQLGKIYNENSADLDILRRQGIELREIEA